MSCVATRHCSRAFPVEAGVSCVSVDPFGWRLRSRCSTKEGVLCVLTISFLSLCLFLDLSTPRLRVGSGPSPAEYEATRRPPSRPLPCIPQYAMIVMTTPVCPVYQPTFAPLLTLSHMSRIFWSRVLEQFFCLMYPPQQISFFIFTAHTCI